MDHDTILRNLVTVETRVSQNQERIGRYREIIESMEGSGHNADFARIMLQECEAVLAVHLSVHEKLLKQLKQLSRTSK
jgi:hypothetical protein